MSEPVKLVELMPAALANLVEHARGLGVRTDAVDVAECCAEVGLSDTARSRATALCEVDDLKSRVQRAKGRA